ncbi:MAG: FHA domain-containing protein [Candidatus Brocadiae bacterium]|nr:FHA domain-containing protein [Candidatus Brocadiia bacterium]
MVTKQPVLIMIQGPEPGTVYKLPDNRITTIGRSSRNTIRAVSSSVSRFHCEVAWINGRWELNDLNSKRGTIVNGRRIADRWVLTPGDIIRTTNTVFRFDMIDETALRDGAIVAIMEAGLDQKLHTRWEASSSLEDIRTRSRLESGHVRDDRRRKPRTLRRDAAFVIVAAAAVGIVVTALLLYAHKHAAPAPGQAARREQQARLLYEEAVAALEAGSGEEALQKLRDLEGGFPDTEAAGLAARARAELLWSVAQRRLADVAEREGENDYADALGLYEELEQLEPDERLTELIEQRRRYTVRLAHASYKTIEQEAERQVAEGDNEAALGLYRRARDRIGLPELAAQAEQKVAELEEGLSQ